MTGYYTGMDAPREEARRTEFRGDKATFTQAMYDAAEEGDLYFMKRSTGAQRYYVPDENGDLRVVTHKRGTYSWELYDGDGNIVIPLWGGDGDPKYAANRAIEQALYDSALGKAIGRDGMRGVAQSLAEKFGLDSFDEYENSDRRFHVNDEENEGIKTALIELLEWAPEHSYPEEIGNAGAEYDGVGFAEDAAEYNNLINGVSDGFGDKTKGDGKPISLMAQPVLYAVAGGKGDGRGIWGRLTRLMEVVGVTWDEVK
jgi:hypothetical protein